MEKKEFEKGMSHAEVAETAEHNAKVDEAMIPETNISELFSDDESKDRTMDAMGEMAADIAVKSQALKEVEGCVKEMTQILNEMKQKLGEMLLANNCKNGHKFDNGCYAKPLAKTKIYKAKGVTDEQLHQFLKDNDMGDIIVDYVHWQTMNATLKEFMSLNGGSLPSETFNVTTEQTMKFVGNGHVKYLAAQKQGGE